MAIFLTLMRDKPNALFPVRLANCPSILRRTTQFGDDSAGDGRRRMSRLRSRRRLLSFMASRSLVREAANDASGSSLADSRPSRAPGHQDGSHRRAARVRRRVPLQLA